MNIGNKIKPNIHIDLTLFLSGSKNLSKTQIQNQFDNCLSTKQCKTILETTTNKNMRRKSKVRQILLLYENTNIFLQILNYTVSAYKIDKMEAKTYK